MYYVEYFRRNAGVPLAHFHAVVRRTVEAWAAQHPQDRCVLLAARTFRLGPEPGYLLIWEFDSFARIDAWKAEVHARDVERHARRTAGDRVEDAFNDVATVEQAGIYDALGEEIL